MAFFTRLIFALIGMAFAVLFAVGVLCWLALYVVFACLRWLVTGQKPQVLMMWQQIQAMRKGMQGGQWHEVHGRTSARDQETVVIEDAVVREIRDSRNVPKD